MTPFLSMVLQSIPERLRDGRSVVLRPGRAGDAGLMQAFVRGLSPASRRQRFFSSIAELPPPLLGRLTTPRDPREVNLLALHGNSRGRTVVGMANCMAEDLDRAEFGIVVADDWQGVGLGRRLLETTVRYAARSGFDLLSAVTFAENAAMLALAARLGFAFAEDPDPDLVRIEKRLPAPVAAGSPWGLTAARI
jgi:acetyltransferase